MRWIILEECVKESAVRSRALRTLKGLGKEGDFRMEGVEVGGTLEEFSVTESREGQCEREKWVSTVSCDSEVR